MWFHMLTAEENEKNKSNLQINTEVWKLVIWTCFASFTIIAKTRFIVGSLFHKVS